MKNLIKAQVISNHFTKYIVKHNSTHYSLEVSGRFKYVAYKKTDFPVVGDYVFFRETNTAEGIIESIEERKNTLSRLSMSNVFNEQIFASNIDIVFICVSMNEDFHIKKILNFINLVATSDFESILLLTKTDLVEDTKPFIDEIRKYSDIEIMAVSIYDDTDVILGRIGLGTSIFIGSSGVGKSTLINKLIGEEKFLINDIRESDAQGRHTTVHKELVELPTGGKIIDSPGIRIINSYHVDNVDVEFKDIIDISSTCKFRDCKHENEPGCEIRNSLDNGDILIERYEQYTKALKFNKHVKKQEAIKEKLQNKRKNNYSR